MQLFAIVMFAYSLVFICAAFYMWYQEHKLFLQWKRYNNSRQYTMSQFIKLGNKNQITMKLGSSECVFKATKVNGRRVLYADNVTKFGNNEYSHTEEHANGWYRIHFTTKIPEISWEKFRKEHNSLVGSTCYFGLADVISWCAMTFKFWR